MITIPIQTFEAFLDLRFEIMFLMLDLAVASPVSTLLADSGIP